MSFIYNSKILIVSLCKQSPSWYSAATTARSGELSGASQAERFLLQNVTQLIGIVQSAVKQELSSTINVLNQLKNNLTNLINKQKSTPVTFVVKDLQQSSSPLNYYDEPQNNKQPFYILVRPAYSSVSNRPYYFPSYYPAGSEYFLNNRRKEKQLMMVSDAASNSHHHDPSWASDDLP